MNASVPPELAIVLSRPAEEQRAFLWNRDSWAAMIGDVAGARDLVGRLTDRVDRHTTRRVVLAELAAGHVLPAFIATMVWGYGDAGYGPTRTRWVLTGQRGRDAGKLPVLTSVAARLAKGAQVVRRDGPLEAYRYLNNAGHCKNLRGAFFTKWLYFTSAVESPDSAGAAPILDAQVAGWLRRHDVVDLSVRKTDSYGNYLSLLGEWGEPYDRTRVQVEQAIFTLARG